MGADLIDAARPDEESRTRAQGTETAGRQVDGHGAHAGVDGAQERFRPHFLATAHCQARERLQLGAGDAPRRRVRKCLAHLRQNLRFADDERP